jgi:hypothetical protein
VLEKSRDYRIEFAPVLAQQAPRFRVAFVSYSPDLFIDCIQQAI